eukprot:448984-Pyramimonas_sp.AAC.1
MTSDDDACNGSPVRDAAIAGPTVGGSIVVAHSRRDGSTRTLSWVLGTRQRGGRRRIFVQSGHSHEQELGDCILGELGKRESFLLRADWLSQIKVKDALLGSVSHFLGRRDRAPDALNMLVQECQGRLWGVTPASVATVVRGPPE